MERQNEICPTCGERLPEGASICENCGTSIPVSAYKANTTAQAVYDATSNLFGAETSHAQQVAPASGVSKFSDIDIDFGPDDDELLAAFDTQDDVEIVHAGTQQQGAGAPCSADERHDTVLVMPEPQADRAANEKASATEILAVEAKHADTTTHADNPPTPRQSPAASSDVSTFPTANTSAEQPEEESDSGAHHNDSAERAARTKSMPPKFLIAGIAAAVCVVAALVLVVLNSGESPDEQPTEPAIVSYTVHYIDAASKKELDTYTGEGAVGSTVTPEAKKISGYTLSKDTANGGKMTLAEGSENSINVLYTQLVNYTVKYVEKGSGDRVKKAKTVKGKAVGSKVTEKAPSISGYTLSSGKKKSITLVSDSGKNVITFTYTKKVARSYSSSSGGSSSGGSSSRSSGSGGSSSGGGSSKKSSSVDGYW